MPDQNRKNKMISLRLSEEEFAALHAKYSSHGARNVSDLARLALQRVIAESPVPEGELPAKVHELDHRMTAVEDHLSLLLEREQAGPMTALLPQSGQQAELALFASLEEPRSPLTATANEARTHEPD